MPEQVPDLSLLFAPEIPPLRIAVKMEVDDERWELVEEYLDDDGVPVTRWEWKGEDA